LAPYAAAEPVPYGAGFAGGAYLPWLAYDGLRQSGPGSYFYPGYGYLHPGYGYHLPGTELLNEACSGFIR
jgi:hypothetical protein